MQAGGLASLAPPAACDLDIFHYITAYVHNMHAIEALIVNRAIWKGRSCKLVEVTE